MMSRISIKIFLFFSVCHCIAGITFRPDEISITTSKPMPIMQKLMKKPLPNASSKMNKSNKTDEIQVVAGDNRIRRLIPYISHYNPAQSNSDFNYPVEYMPVHQQQHQPMAIRKKPQQLQIPSIAVLYNTNKYPQHRPNVQAGFIYKIRQPSSHQQPVMQPSYNSYKYQQPNVYHQIPNVPNHLTNSKKNVAPSNEKNIFTPFSESNKIPGEFVPIFKQKNLPYKSFINDVKVVANVKDVISRTPSLTPTNHHPMKPYDDDEFIPMTPYAQHHHHYNYHPSTSQNHLYHSKIISPMKSTSTPLTFSKPSPQVIYVTTSTERPTNTDFPPNYSSPSSSTSDENNFESSDDDSSAALDLSPDYYKVKVTTFAPDDEYRKRIKASANKIELESITNVEEIEVPSPTNAELLTSEIPETSPKLSHHNTKITKILSHLKSNDIIEKKKKAKKQHFNSYDDYDYSNDDDDGNDSINHGRPGVDYPNFHHIPETNFSCRDQRYKGFFGDPETNCQVWHYCDLNGGKASFLCPNGTIFSQATLTCDWWFNVKCSSTPQLYVLNERLYKFILPFTPKFPEDYSGPLVDKYLEVKFQEMEEKMRLEKEKGRKSEDDSSSSDESKNDQNEIDDELPGGHTLEGADDDIQSLNHERSLPSTEKVFVASPETTTSSTQSVDASEEETNFILSSELPPIPNTIVDQQRLEMIEIKHDGASGHLTHEI